MDDEMRCMPRTPRSSTFSPESWPCPSAPGPETESPPSKRVHGSGAGRRAPTENAAQHTSGGAGCASAHTSHRTRRDTNNGMVPPSWGDGFSGVPHVRRCHCSRASSCCRETAWPGLGNYSTSPICHIYQRAVSSAYARRFTHPALSPQLRSWRSLMPGTSQRAYDLVKENVPLSRALRSALSTTIPHRHFSGDPHPMWFQGIASSWPMPQRSQSCALGAFTFQGPHLRPRIRGPFGDHLCRQDVGVP